MALVQEWERGWVTLDRGIYMKRLNTNSIYQLGQRIAALTSLVHKEGMTSQDASVFVPLFRAEVALAGC